MNLIGKRYLFFLISLLVILPGIASLAVPPALRLGIDFTGGSTMSITFSRPVDQAALREELSLLGHPEALVQKTGEREFFIRTRTLKEVPGEVSEKAKIQQALEERFPPIEALEFFSVSPIIAAEKVRNATIAVVVAAIGILLYIAWAFRRMPSPFKWATCAVIALVHDTLVVLGLFSILGKVMNLEVNTMFIIGILTVIGYSINNTVVVFDRIRENLSRGRGGGLEGAVNLSLGETLGRSLNTSLTTLFAILALLFFGGPTIRNFLLVLLIGVIAGTYSSFLIASQILVSWEKGDVGKLFQRIPALARRT